jgi:pimeloyl-ACP methyl ester carboxylesterase
MSGKIVLFTTMKNEGPYMLEWVAFHRMLGVDHFLIFTNDCSDGTDEIARQLETLGWVTHVPNEVADRVKPQRQMLDRARVHPVVVDAEWLMCLDVDEFWNIRVGAGGFADLIAATEDKAGGTVDAISFAWKLFGSSGNVAFQDAPVTRSFTLCDLDGSFHSRRASGLKTLFRNNGKFDLYGPHRPKGFDDGTAESIRWADAGGNLFPAGRVGWRAWRGFDHSFGRLHHYSVRSLEAFLVKRDRGRTNHVATDQAEEYWLDMNANKVADLSILPRAEAAEPLLQKLHDDPELARLHRAACDWHRDRIEEIKARSDWEAFRQWLQENLLGAAALPFSDPVPDGGTEPVSEGQPAAQEPAEGSDPRSGPATDAAPEPEVAAPWLADLAPGGSGRGFLRKLDNYALHFSERSSRHLVISFDNLAEVNNTSISRESWGRKFFAGQGHAHVGVFARKKAWYRDMEVIDLMADLAAMPSVRGYERIALVGTSMGGFAALAFAPLFPGADVVAFNPQTTLDERLVPWEKRYGMGVRQNWDLPFGDGRAAVATSNRVTVFYDPFHEPDKKHAEMIEGDRVVHLKCWFANHYCAPMLRKLDLLKPVMETAIAGELDPALFYEWFRARKGLPWHFRALSQRAEDTGHQASLERARQCFFSIRRSNQAKAECDAEQQISDVAAQ